MPSVQPAPMLIRSDLKVPSSSECACMMAAILSVVPLPTLVSVRSMMAQPSSNTRRPIRTPSSRQAAGLNGVPSNSRR